MRILLTADPELPVPPVNYGGIERIVDALARALAASGHEIGLMANTASTCAVKSRFAWPAPDSRGAVNTVRNALALRRSVRSFQPDVLHSFSRLAYLGPLLPSNVPKIMSYQRHTGGRQIAWAARMASDSLRFTGCSEYIAAMGRRAGGTWHAIPNFVELEKFDYVPRVPPDAPLVFLSRVESIKGADLAIAIARAAGRRLMIAGNHARSGPERVFWDRAIAPAIGRDGIDYCGPVDDAQKNSLLGRAAALVVPIQWDEPFGIVFAEALAAGTPIISCARGALPEIVRPGVTGYFIQTAADGVDAVRRLDQLDRAACRRDAAERFSVGPCAARYLEVYRMFDRTKP
jgi:glycosyltransferase involved in cell wall biosynthesis